MGKYWNTHIQNSSFSINRDITLATVMTQDSLQDLFITSLSEVAYD
jgi:hypothetical protein